MRAAAWGTARALTFARGLCGCRALEDLRGEAVDQVERDARERASKKLQARWGCPRAGLTPPAELPRDLRGAAEDHARVTGCAASGTCPWARSLSPWAAQVLKLHRIATTTKGTVRAESILGRPPHVWDVAAVDALICADADRCASDEKIREAERERDRPPKR